MSESWGQSESGSGFQDLPGRGLSAAADEFRRSVQDASERLGSAGAQLVAMSQELASAISEAKAAAERAQEAQRKTEELQTSLQRDYGAVSNLVRELQDRIGALAVLARPLSIEPVVATEAPSEDAGTPAPDPEPEQPAAEPTASEEPAGSSNYGTQWGSRSW